MNDKDFIIQILADRKPACTIFNEYEKLSQVMQVSVICTLIDIYAMDHGNDPIELAGEIFQAMKSVNETYGRMDKDE